MKAIAILCSSLTFHFILLSSKKNYLNLSRLDFEAEMRIKTGALVIFCQVAPHLLVHISKSN